MSKLSDLDLTPQESPDDHYSEVDCLTPTVTSQKCIPIPINNRVKKFSKTIPKTFRSRDIAGSSLTSISKSTPIKTTYSLKSSKTYESQSSELNGSTNSVAYAPGFADWILPPI